MKNFTAAIFLSFVFSNFASATLVNITFTDNDGPQWTGVVDTSTDSLTIQTWIEGTDGQPF